MNDQEEQLISYQCPLYKCAKCGEIFESNEVVYDTTDGKAYCKTCLRKILKIDIEQLSFDKLLQLVQEKKKARKEASNFTLKIVLQISVFVLIVSLTQLILLVVFTTDSCTSFLAALTTTMVTVTIFLIYYTTYDLIFFLYKIKVNKKK